MRIFSPDKIVAKSRFWYFLGQLKKVKKTTGEIVSLKEVRIIVFVWLNSFESPVILIVQVNYLPSCHNYYWAVTFRLDPWTLAHQNQEFRYLASLWFSIWNPQHVPWISRPLSIWSRNPVLSWYGSSSPCKSSLDSGIFLYFIMSVLLSFEYSNCARFQIIKVEPVAAKSCRRPHIKQFHDSKIRFPLPHRVQGKRRSYNTFSIRRPKASFL